jgi:hypothetical protein
VNAHDPRDCESDPRIPWRNTDTHAEPGCPDCDGAGAVSDPETGDALMCACVEHCAHCGARIAWTFDGDGYRLDRLACMCRVRLMRLELDRRERLARLTEPAPPPEGQ